MEEVTRFFKDSSGSYFLFGPRGTGKSTWVKKLPGSTYRIDLLDPEACHRFQVSPGRLKEIVDGNPFCKTFVIDEVQKVPDLLSVVHLLIERKTGLRFILTGSSARKLRRTGVNLLAGRALLRTMHPFMASELGGGFRLNDALELGMLPLVRASGEPEKVLKSYCALYVKEEVQAEGLVRNIGNFARFLEAISFSHGSVLNVSSVARECGVERKVVEAYVQILEDLLLSFRVPVFQKRAGRAVVSHPKFFYFDAGVYRSLRPSGPLDRPEEIQGLALEGLVAQHLRAWNAYSGGNTELFFWRTRSGVEVDFIVYGEETFTALEIKNSRHVRSADLKGLRALREDYPEAKCILLYRGAERLMKDGIWCIPCEEFLLGLTPGRPVGVAA